MEELIARDASANDRPATTVAIRAYDCGIVVGAVYGSVLSLATLYLGQLGGLPEIPHLGEILVGLVGFLSGAIVSFGRVSGGEEPNLRQNLIDTLVTALWVLLVLSTANLIVPFVEPLALLVFCGVLIAGGMVGSLIGRPVLGWMAHIRIKGRQPFLFVNRFTASISNDNVRFVVRVVVQTLLLALLLVLAFAVFIVFVAIVLLWLGIVIMGWVMAMMSGGSSGGSYSGGHSHDSRAEEERQRRKQEEARRKQEEARRKQEERDRRVGVGKHYDESGRYVGKTLSDGNEYDQSGRRVGKTQDDGTHYDAVGHKLGRTDSDGNEYDTLGRKVGQTDEYGRHTDKMGRFTGRTEK